jgi:hypothetical protein
MTTHLKEGARPESRRLADLRNDAAELERRLSDTRVLLDRELAESGGDWPQEAPEPVRGYAGGSPGGRAHAVNGRTEQLVSHGRPSAYSPRVSPVRKVAIGAAVVAAVVTAVVMMLPGGRASWPTSVATVQGEAARACQNPNVISEPGQVNFACAKSTRQILWVFALLTSADKPNFNDAKTGRLGLEPITPAQGGEVAWSLNLHHPYNPADPIDSLEVAARAINNIVGGATFTAASGKQVVQPGLESRPANCARYTGSAAVISRAGFPNLCARPVASTAGQAALVADVYRKWIVGARPVATHDAVVLFENANDPGSPRVQAILRRLPNSKLLG